MKRIFFFFALIFAISTFSLNQLHAQLQVLEGGGLDLMAAQTSGWFNQIRFRDDDKGPIRHVITDHGVRDRLIIYPGFGGGANAEVEISGKVAISTTEMPLDLQSGAVDLSNYKLFVNGGILAEELRVATGWADYVFDENYKLLPLKEVEAFILAHKHLPNIPSAQKIETEGLALGEITVKQQEKIEELFLYIIEVEKELKILKQENKELRQEVDSLKE